MKYLGYLAVDLGQTELETQRPDSTVLGWINRATGLFSQEVEREVLQMAALLDAVHQTLAERKHDNVIRFMVDETTCYDDSEARAGDLDEALAATDPARLTHADRVQLIVEEEDDDDLLYVVFNILVYRQHAPGTFPIWFRATAIEKDLLRLADEKPRPYQQRVRALLEDPAELKRRRDRGVECLSGMLGAIRDTLLGQLDIEGTQQGAYMALQSSSDDYYLSLRPEMWDAAQLVVALAADVELPEDIERAASKPLREFVDSHENKLAQLENKLLKGSSRGLGRGPATWTEFSKRRVYNAKTGRVVQIRSLPREQQHTYRMVFNRSVPSDEQVEMSWGLVRMLGKVSRGVTAEVAEALEGVREKAPQTYAFIRDKAFRRRIYRHAGVVMGQEMHDLADTMAHTIVRELIQTGKVPVAWYKGNKVHMSDADHQAAEDAHQQMMDIAELSIGSLIPIGGFAVGGPLGGVIGLAGIKLFQKSLNWYSKRNGGREWTILPSAWRERAAELDEGRAEERGKSRSELTQAASTVRRHAEAEERQALIQIQRQLAENFRDFGRRLEEGEVPIDEDLLDVSTLKEGDIKAALAEEARVGEA